MRYVDSFKLYKALLSRERELNRFLRDGSFENSSYLRALERLKEVQHFKEILVSLTKDGSS